MFSFKGKKTKLNFDNPEVQNNIANYLGKPADFVYHSPVPFEMGHDAGGGADVYIYDETIPVKIYVTGNLIGTKQKKSDAGNYELMICQTVENKIGPNLISKLAYYTLEASLNSNETLEIGPYAHGNISAVIFDKFAEFEVNGKKLGLLVLIGITKEELEWKNEYGGEMLIQKLREKSIYPFTVYDRASIV